MNRWCSCAVVMVVALSASCIATAPPQKEEKTRNPFKVKDVPNPDGEDVKTFAAEVAPAGGDKDSNAAQWVDETAPGKKGSLDGDWSSRWKGGTAGTEWTTGTARVKSAGDRVYILYSDRTSTYLLDARRDGKKLVGRWVNNAIPQDTSPWVGVIVNDERIDGLWSMGRWDLRRKIADK
jgi:hypothetical protein